MAGALLSRLRRHPFPVEARFEHCLVLAYAVPEAELEPLLPPGLRVDAWNGLGFLAAAFVQTRGLRPKRFPAWAGRDFFLSGYRVFTRFATARGRTLRGLRILRSDTDSRVMSWSGNLLTHYNYKPCRATIEVQDGRLGIEVDSADGQADVSLVADLAGEQGLPPGSPFPSLREARKFAGPLPFTFDHDEATGGMVVIEGQRPHWDPRPVPVTVRRLGFLHTLGLDHARLANAFAVHDVPYGWKRGVLEPIAGPASAPAAAGGGA